MKKSTAKILIGASVIAWVCGMALVASAQVDVNTRLRDFLNGSRQTVTLDGATTIAVPRSSYFVLECTGAETINTITGGVQGLVLYIENSDTDCTIADDDVAVATNAVDLTGTATTDVGAASKVLVLIYNGTYWLEVTESDN